MSSGRPRAISGPLAADVLLPDEVEGLGEFAGGDEAGQVDAAREGGAVPPVEGEQRVLAPRDEVRLRGRAADASERGGGGARSRPYEARDEARALRKSSMMPFHASAK